MNKTFIYGRIPSQEECYRIMTQYSMLPNIAEHSYQVMCVTLAIADNLRKGVMVDRDLMIAAALLHDITKARSLKTQERHDLTGGLLLRELGFICIAEIVEQHVVFNNFKEYGALEEREIVFYADKRVMHNRIVTVDERIQDLVNRYGLTEEISDMIIENKCLIHSIECKIAGFMQVDLHEAIAAIESNSISY